MEIGYNSGTKLGAMLSNFKKRKLLDRIIHTHEDAIIPKLFTLGRPLSQAYFGVDGIFIAIGKRNEYFRIFCKEFTVRNFLIVCMLQISTNFVQ